MSCLQLCLYKIQYTNRSSNYMEGGKLMQSLKVKDLIPHPKNEYVVLLKPARHLMACAVADGYYHLMRFGIP